MPAIPINQPVLAPIITITLLMNLEFEYQLKVCVGCLCCDIHHPRPLRIANGAPFGPSVHCSVKSSLKIIGLGILHDCNEDYMDTK